MNVYNIHDEDIIHETSIDFVLRPVFTDVHLVQYDEGLPIVKVNLYRNGRKYILPNNVEANVRFLKSSSSSGVSVLGCNTEKDAIYFDVKPDMTSSSGKFTFVLELVYNSNNTTKRACSSPILVTIDRNPIQVRPI